MAIIDGEMTDSAYLLGPFVTKLKFTLSHLHLTQMFVSTSIPNCDSHQSRSA